MIAPCKQHYSNSILKLLPLLIAFFVFSGEVFSQGNLMIMPKRVVFDGTKRSEELNLANIGKDSATYMISFMQLRMNEDGTFKQITQPDSTEFFADKNVRFYPRSVTLAPNEAQSVKIQIIKTGELTPGEYRSHLYFRAIPKEKPLGEKESRNDSSISVSLIPIFGISIPIIIRVGENNAGVSISDVTFIPVNDSTPALKFTFNRTGNMSVYGDLAVEHIAENGVKTRVGVVKGLAVYTPNRVRKTQVALNKIQGVNFHSGQLHLVYTDQTSKANVLAQEVISLH